MKARGTTDNYFIDLNNLIETAKHHYPTLTVKKKKDVFIVTIKSKEKFEWLQEGRDELISLLSGLVIGYEINVLNC